MSQVRVSVFVLYPTIGRRLTLAQNHRTSSHCLISKATIFSIAFSRHLQPLSLHILTHFNSWGCPQRRRRITVDLYSTLWLRWFCNLTLCGTSTDEKEQPASHEISGG